MADEPELLSALVQGLRDLGVPSPERCFLRTRWAAADLVAQVHWPDFQIQVKIGKPLTVYTDHVLADARLLFGPELLRLMREQVPRDGLALLRAELNRIRTRYPHLAHKARWPQDWPDPPTRHLVTAASGLPFHGINS
jgi:hypothetical protein